MKEEIKRKNDTPPSHIGCEKCKSYGYGKNGYCWGGFEVIGGGGNVCPCPCHLLDQKKEMSWEEKFDEEFRRRNITFPLDKTHEFIVKDFIRSRFVEKEELRRKLESLAELEHDQWVSWTRAVDEQFGSLLRQKRKVSDREVLWLLLTIQKKWRNNWKPYKELTEEEKEKDRVWAREVLKLLEEK